MYKNLKAELVRNSIKHQDIANLLDITRGTATLKINGKARICLDEAFKIQELIYEKTKELIPLEELFKV